MNAENDKITAAAAVDTSCPQNPKFPSLWKYLAVLSNLFDTWEFHEFSTIKQHSNRNFPLSVKLQERLLNFEYHNSVTHLCDLFLIGGISFLGQWVGGRRTCRKTFPFILLFCGAIRIGQDEESRGGNGECVECSWRSKTCESSWWKRVYSKNSGRRTTEEPYRRRQHFSFFSDCCYLLTCRQYCYNIGCVKKIIR